MKKDDLQKTRDFLECLDPERLEYLYKGQLVVLPISKQLLEDISTPETKVINKMLAKLDDAKYVDSSVLNVEDFAPKFEKSKGYESLKIDNKKVK